MKDYSSFYESFYGSRFARYFRRPSDWKTFRTQYTVKTPKQLNRLINENSGIHNCFVSIYDYGTVDALRQKKEDNLCIDRVYFDFDIHNAEAKVISDNLKDLRGGGLNYARNVQDKLKTRLKNLIINEKIAKPAIDEVKLFAKLFKKDFGKEPLLVFSGSKGCHAYCFMEPVKLDNPNDTITYFAERVKTAYGFKTLDLSVNKGALARLSRVPYSKHQLTGLSVIPFKSTDSYEEIISKSLKSVIEPFNIENHLTRFDKHLKSNDKILEHNKEVRVEMEAVKRKSTKNYAGMFKSSKIGDHREFFRQILGEPAGEYEHYNMYHCPFSDHEDKHPSFQVYHTGYKCYGCGRKGNHWQFLKEYYGWTDNQVRGYLKSKKE